MKFLSFVALASLAVAAPTEKRAPTPLEVKLEMVGNSEVKATISNTGKNSLKVLKTGSILDTAAVEKAHVMKADKDVEFDGIRYAIATKDLGEEDFERIASGQTIEVTFDVAEVHDLSEGGKFDISVAGAFSFAQEDSTELIGSVPFESEHLDAEVNGEEASSARIAFHEKRAIVQSDCTGSRLTAIRNSHSACVTLASRAQTAASSGAAAKMTEFFKSSTTSTRNTVAGVFSAMRSECGSTTSGVSRAYCTDVFGACTGSVIAYTVPASSYIAYCPYFFNNMPANSNGCYTQTQANTVVHEITHLRQIKGTSDYGGYGYNFVRSLSASQNLNHADTYTLFAQSLYAGC